MRSTQLVLVATLLVVNLFAQHEPKAVSNPAPTYPPETAELGYGGTVKVAVKVDKKGAVKVMQAYGPNAPCSDIKDGRIKKIRKAVVDAANQVAFEPLIRNGRPAEFELTLSYTFDSNGKPARTNDVSGSARRIVDAGVLQGRVKYFARPDYPSGARANRVSGSVPVSILVGLDGKVIAASALGGHPLLQDPAVDAACRSLIEPFQIPEPTVKVSGVITFNFVV